ncbi:KAT8 regulatory NSL complex subunit 2 [Strongylocentrotus purpuratus]|uniref:KAT8 regulatory NSL complex subunit 2 n=1 Tax=Strongylocentrotus purpuratus TaxID=7668 RepID=A0A7M7N0P8_STRPU|nr:KAT8 regulatory NSL complex subunit 2 [Strongylocentrotus purpuratus]
MYRSKGGHSSRKAGRSESLFCNYPHRICMQDRYEGYEYCMNHILEDKSSSFKQCNFVSTKTGQKCHKPAPKADRKEGYCPAHARKASQMRHKAALKAKPTDVVKDTLDELDYYRPASIKSVPEVPSSLATKILDYGSESESEGDPLMLEQGWRGTTDSDAESVDSEQEDALKYAGVYTAEEAALITRDKLIRLQSLYINQFKKLQHVMKEKRRSYLVALRQEREAFGIDFGVITDPKQKRKFREYQAARGFRRRRGKEALLYQKSKQRRIQATADYQGRRNVPLMLQCCHKSCEGEQCSKFSLPLAKFCKDHILMDPKQVLYSECSKGGKVCDKPASPMSQDESCLLHMGLPQHKPFKPYEPEPPPPPPQPKPSPPPTIIPIPEAMLPPAPILPSQLDSQIDQLLQFQPHFLEQQLQQHVYDASQYMGSFAPPDVDVVSQREASMDTSASPAKRGKNIEDELDDDTNTPGEIHGNPSEEHSNAKPDAQTDVHVDVETDSDVLPPVLEPQQKPNCDKPAAQQSNHVESPTFPKAEDVKDAMNTQPIVETVDQQSPVKDEGSEKSSLGGVADTMAFPEGETQPAYELDASSMVQSGTSANLSADEKMDEETALTVHRATGDHNYNQQPFDMSESADPIIDVT